MLIFDFRSLFTTIRTTYNVCLGMPYNVLYVISPSTLLSCTSFGRKIKPLSTTGVKCVKRKSCFFIKKKIQRQAFIPKYCAKQTLKIPGISCTLKIFQMRDIRLINFMSLGKCINIYIRTYTYTEEFPSLHIIFISHVSTRLTKVTIFPFSSL